MPEEEIFRMDDDADRELVKELQDQAAAHRAVKQRVQQLHDLVSRTVMRADKATGAGKLLSMGPADLTSTTTFGWMVLFLQTELTSFNGQLHPNAYPVALCSAESWTFELVTADGRWQVRPNENEPWEPVTPRVVELVLREALEHRRGE